jgi:AcrR family transcriptional regulator
MPRAGLTAERVAAAAADLADTVGFENVTVSALARSFGVADASLYSHVRNVRDLRTRVAVRSAGDLADVITTAVAGRSGRDALAAFADAYRTFALAHPGRYAATRFPLDPAVAAGSAGHVRVIETTYALLHGYGLAEPGLTDAVRLLRSTCHGFVSLMAEDGFGSPRDVTASWHRIVDALDHTLRTWPAEGDLRADVQSTGS